MSPEPTWRYRVRADGDARTVALSGEIDINGAEELHTLLQEAVDAGSGVQVDLAQVTFIDSTVITALIKSRNSARVAGRRFAVVNPAAQVHRVLAVTGVLNALTSGTR
ncbi:STAS domain-containing protein [Micromonospora sp. 4G57]|uniref:Anti-sigma factor antagonist n=1 Tax=Micromonospora sicca TaxID=2202420 RepID=A0ABU5JBL0_9ACTN|nr:MULTISPECIES: STAS domain-containing protein [unclassified Micromonospora]MDZ5441578.1 STAS domain-containing protein [Micromonospora sp. 4G57]MDZ5489975.1 STAS domain-containing protein [Micromonospora sp. 4G53]